MSAYRRGVYVPISAFWDADEYRHLSLEQRALVQRVERDALLRESKRDDQ